MTMTTRPRTTGRRMQHRPERVGEDRNGEFSQYFVRFAGGQHRPERVGEDRNWEETMMPDQGRFTAPTLSGR